MVRGGDSTEDDEMGNSDTASEDDESYSDKEGEQEIEVHEEPSESTPQEIESARLQAQLSQQSRNFGIATALWSSLFFDSILNKAKRAHLFPAADATSALLVSSNAVPTALLASGFALASSVSFLLWRDFDIRSEMNGDDQDNVEGTGKGDWFLSLSNSVRMERTDAQTEKFASLTRKRLFFHLALFGLLNLGAHVGYYFSEASPFLGLSAAAINVHNSLVVVNALLKETNVSGLFMQVLQWPLSLFSNERGEHTNVDALSFLFQVGAVVFWVRCIPALQVIVSLTRGLVSGIDPSSLVNNSRQLSLQIASLGRLTLAAGISQALFSCRINSVSNKLRHHPFFAVLSGMASLTCFGVGGTLIFTSWISGIRLSSILSKTFPLDGVLLLMMGLASGYNAILGINTNLTSKLEAV